MEKLTLNELYGEAYDCAKKRYCDLANSFGGVFSKQPTHFFSAPGRTEIGGNHTDHNMGLVLAASVCADIAAAVCPAQDGIIRLCSQGYGEVIVIDTADTDIHTEEHACTASLIRGVVSGLKRVGSMVGGFWAYVVSDVPEGAGLSSSAAFEVLIGTILNGLYNDGNIDDTEIAKVAQFAENKYFGKPSGLMDQLACSLGGLVMIDLEDSTSPSVERIDTDFSDFGHALCIVDTGGSHAKLTDDYAMIPSEMKSVAKYFGKTALREISRDMVTEKLADIRTACGDRALLRALHFFDENERVKKEAEALKCGDIGEFLRTVNESGMSSLAFLQNIFSASNVSEQGLTLALYTAKQVLVGAGAYRVHGGGFAGTIQAFVPFDKLDEFKKHTERIFGDGACHVFTVRKYGGVQIGLQV